MNHDLATAWQLHQAGRFADAARGYSALLEREPNDADALHLFGVLHFEHGYFARAVELIGRAVALRPESASFHANLAEAYRGLGQPQRAIDCCQAALRLQPNFPEAANSFGLALHDLRRYAEAVTQYRAALEMRPGFALAQNNLGTSLRELGRTLEALAAFRAAVELDPALPMAQSNLAQMLVDEGAAEEALLHGLEAVRLNSTLPASHNNLGNVYRALERWAEAHAEYDEAERLAPELAPVHANRGVALHLEGRHAPAFACFRRAIELAPDDAEMWHYLADAHAADEDHAAALPCWERIIALQPTQATAHNDLGFAMQEEGRLAEAAACYRRALELQPEHLESLLNQGHLHEELGELAEAEACYRRAQSAHPWAPAPLSRLAMLVRGKLPEADRQAIEERLKVMSATAPARSPLLFGLAQALDARKEYRRAAECLAEANRLALEQNRKRGRNYDPAVHAALVDRVIAGFTPELFERLAGAGDDTRRPVFVFGLPRSGTTLTEQVLASHSQIFGAGELRVARQGFESVPTVLGQPDNMQACLELLDAPAIRELSRRHLDALQATCNSQQPERPVDRIVDKMPDNYIYLGFLALLFPRATFIYVRRDLRDVALSCWRTNFRSIRWANDPEHLAARFHEHHRLMAHWRKVLPVPVHEMAYEQLVEDFEGEARRLVSACGLDWEPACLDFHRSTRPVRTASVTQVRQPLYRGSVAHWKHYAGPLAELFGRLPG